MSADAPASPPAPPLAGDWKHVLSPGTGSWTLGDLWWDHAAGKCCMLVLPRHCNAHGSMHGGALATLADAQAYAVRDYSGAIDDHTPTVSLSVDYLAPVAVGDWLLVDVTLLRTTRTLLFTQGIMSVGDRVVARSNIIYRNISGKGAS